MPGNVLYFGEMVSIVTKMYAIDLFNSVTHIKSVGTSIYYTHARLPVEVSTINVTSLERNQPLLDHRTDIVAIQEHRSSSQSHPMLQSRSRAAGNNLYLSPPGPGIRPSAGVAFQIADDVLDFSGTDAELGKPACQDAHSR